jgi:SpoU rRNA methylase family enzyme
MEQVVRRQVGDLEVELSYEDQIYYAAVVNGRPFIRSLTIRATDAKTNLPAAVSLDVVSLGQKLASTWTRSWTGATGDSQAEFTEFSEIVWDASKLWEIDERQPAEVVVKFPGLLVDPAVFTAEVSSPRTWNFVNEDSYAALSAFVQPNHPALRPILDKAVEKLRSGGHQPQLSGYQDMQLVPYMVQAVYDAVCDLKLTYSNPPASWADPGQKIRDAQMIVDERVGTCLDTAVLFASLLENIGLNPVLMVIPGHAFVGFWVRPNRGFDQEASAVRDVVSAIESGLVQLFETTVVTDGGAEVSFTEALAAGSKHVSQLNLQASTRPGDTATIIDIAVCRSLFAGSRSVVPMPARYIRADGSIEVVEYKPEELSISRLIAEVSEAVAQNMAAAKGIDVDVPPRLKNWLDDLLDLSLNNPLINFKKPARSLSLVTPVGALGTIEDLLHQNVEFGLTPHALATELQGDRGVADVRGGVLVDPEGNALEVSGGQLEYEVADALKHKMLFVDHDLQQYVKRSRAIVSEAKSFTEETGSNGLYLALGSLVWVPDGKKEVRSPLILVPVHLIPKARSTQFFLSLDTSSEITPNFSLAEKLRRELGLKLEDLVNLKEDDSGIDVPGTFQHIRQRLTEANLEGFRVDENAVLGFFDFSTYRLWRDLVDNWREFEKNPLIKHLIYTPNEAFVDPNTDAVVTDLDQLTSELPIEADSSQVNAVAQALAGKTFVMQGPPGTGKSQTITNMLARALNDGKRVLFVAEKKDALDVVVERLNHVGLRPFILDLHDKGMSFKAVKEQLSAVVDLTISSDRVGFEAAVSDYAQAIAPLQKYRDELHAVGDQGESLSSALDRLLAVSGDATVTVPGSFVSQTRVAERERLYQTALAISDLGPAAGTVKTNPWCFTNRAAELSADELATIRSGAGSLAKATQALTSHPEVSAFISGLTNIDDLDRLNIVRLGALEPDVIALAQGPQAREARRRATQSIVEMLNFVENSPGSYENVASAGIEAMLAQATAASTAFMGGMKISKIVKIVNQAMGWTVLNNKASVISDLTGLLTVERSARTVEADLRAVSGLQVPAGFSPYSATSLKSVRDEIGRLDQIAAFTEMTLESGASGEGFLKAVSSNGLTEQVISLADSTRTLFETLSSEAESLARWQANRNLGEALLASAPGWQVDASSRDLMELTRWIGLLAAFEPFREFNLDEAIATVLAGDVSFDAFPSAFLRGYYSSLVELLMVQRGFHNFDGVQIDSYVKRLTDAQARLRKQLPDVLAERLFDRRGFDPSSRLGAIGDLLMVLGQQRAPKGVGVRSLLKKFWTVITRMTPCVLASPDSTVRFIAPELENFDLVIFDEASQIRVAHSLGAIGRANAAVIAGDTKQMPPTSVAKISNDSAGTDEAVEEQDEMFAFTGDAESILSQCSNARVPEIMLNWHYRSEDESLIAFSNAKYYDRKLLSFPSPDASRENKGLSFQFVEDGVFVRPGMSGESPKGTNLAEAKAILAEIARRAADDVLSDDSVGIVTFNIQQRDLIESMLIESKDPNIQRALVEGLGGEEIFVKNLESVQGKERDVVLFSVAFSKNAKGEVPLNFGPLNNTGGQRRLNVAITRARKQVKVFCSFLPAELMKRNPGSIGVRHLAEFLKMAYEGAESNPALFADDGIRIDRFRAQVVAAMRESGFVVKEDVGLSGFKVDIAVYEKKTSEQAVMGILLDGASWNSRETVVDRDVLPSNVLVNKMAWPSVERVWLPAWLRDQAGEIDRLRKALATAVEISKKPRPRKERPKLAIGSTPSPENANSESASTAEAAKTSRAGSRSGSGRGSSTAKVTSTGAVMDALQQFLLNQTPFGYATPEIYGPQSNLDFLFDKNMITAVRTLAAHLTAIEGPVSRERLARFIGACFSFTKLAAKRIEDINAVKFPGHARDNEDFIYPAGIEPANYTAWMFAVEGVGERREIDEISLREISNTAVALCRQFQGMQEESLVKTIMTAFNIQRGTPKIVGRTQAGIELAVSEGRLVHSGEYYTVASKGD